MNYLQQKASPWVSAAVLAGGLATALILFFVVNLEKESGVLARPAYDDIGEL